MNLKLQTKSNRRGIKIIKKKMLRFKQDELLSNNQENTNPIMKSCPNCRVNYYDITFNFCLQDGTLLSAENYREAEIETVMNPKNTRFEEPEVETVVRENFHSATPYNSKTCNITEPIVAINIAQQYPLAKNDYELYQVTRGLWRLSKKRAETAHFALSVYQGEIKEVYEIESWQPMTFDLNEFWIKRKREQGEEIDPKINNNRFQFTGKVAPDSIRSKYVGKYLPKPHGQNPIRYFNC